MSKTNLIQLKVSPDLKQQLEQKALEKGLTLTAYVRMILIENVQKE